MLDIAAIRGTRETSVAKAFMTFLPVRCTRLLMTSLWKMLTLGNDQVRESGGEHYSCGQRGPPKQMGMRTIETWALIQYNC